jgi:hypothetical protein
MTPQLRLVNMSAPHGCRCGQCATARPVAAAATGAPPPPDLAKAIKKHREAEPATVKGVPSDSLVKGLQPSPVTTPKGGR